MQGRNTAEPQPRIHGELRTFGLDVSERSVVHFNVTEHPTAEWKTQQIVDAFPDDTAPRWLLRDSDTIYSDAFSFGRVAAPRMSLDSTGREDAMADVFVSYPREEQQRVRDLVAALARCGREVWVDWGSIPPSAEWHAEISAGIEGADVFVALLTRGYSQSMACGQELAHAVRHNKRIVPIAVDNLDGPEVPPEVARINWLWWQTEDDVETICDRLVRAIEIDLEWVRAHTRLLVRAREWQDRERDTSLLLRGRDLTVMETLLAGNHVDPSTTSEQIQYIVHSRKSATRRQRLLASVISLALLITAALGVTAEVMRREADRQAEISLTRQLAAQSTLVRERNVDQLPYATLLAAEAVKRSIARGIRVPEPEQALRAVLDVLPGRQFVVADAAKSVLAGDGISLFTVDRTGMSRLHHLNRAHEARELAHAGETIEQSAFSPDGTYLVTATSAGTVRLWSTRSFENLTTKKLAPSITALAMSYDAFAAAANGTITVWQLPTGREIASLHVGDIVTVLALFHDAYQQLAVALSAPRGTITIADAKTGELTATLKVDDAVVAISPSPDGRKLIVEEQHQHTLVYEPEEGITQIPTAGGRTFRVWAVDGWKEIAMEANSPGGFGRHVSLAPGAVDPESNRLAVGSVYRAVQIWDLENGRRLSSINEVDFGSALQFSADGRRLATGTSNGTVSVWEVGVPRQEGTAGVARISTFKTEGPIRSLSLAPSGLNIVVHGGSTVSVWSVGQEAVTIPERDPHDLEFTAAGQVAIWSEGTRTVADANSGIVLTREKADPAPRPRAAETSHVGRLIASRRGTREVEVKDAGSGSVLSHFSADADISGVILSADGKWLIVEESADKISVWEAATGRRVIQPFKYFDNYIVQFSPNGQLIAANDGTNRVFIWSLPQRHLATLEHPGDSFSHLEFAAEGAWLITTARVDDDRMDYTARLWRADGWTRAAFVDDTATAVRVSGGLIAAGFKDGRVTLFDATTGAARMTSIVLEAPVTTLSFSADGRWLAAAANDRVQVFDARGRNDIARLQTRGKVQSVVFSPDNRWLASAASEATQVWRLRPDELLAETCARLQRGFTESEWRTAFGNVAQRPTCQR